MELKIEELLTNCEACRGTGCAAPYAPGYDQRYWRLLFGYRPKPCPECAGRGFTPTASGLVVLGFVKRAQKGGLFDTPPPAARRREWPAVWLLRHRLTRLRHWLNS